MDSKTLSIIIKAQDEASKVLAGIGDRMGSLGAIALKYGKIAATAFGTAGVAATGFAVKSAAGFEQTRIGLENMLGSADSARKVLAQVSKFAAETPFEFPELAGAVKQLVAFGFTGQDAVKTMKQLGDVSAAVGAPIGDIAYLMGTLRTQGRAFTIDIRQFAQRGIPIYEYLAKTMHTTEKNIASLIEEGKVGFPEVQKAFEAMTAEGGKFHGAMAAQSKSLSGLWSTLKDNIGLAARELVGINQEGDVKSGSLFDNTRKRVAELIDVLDKIDWGKVSAAVMQMASTITSHIADIAVHLKDLGVMAYNYLTPAFQAIADKITQVTVPAFKDFAAWYAQLPALLQTALNPLLALATHVHDLTGFFYELIEGTKQLWAGFANNSAVIAIAQFFGQVFVPAIKAVWASIAENLLPALGQLWDSVVRLWNSLNPGLTEVLKVVAIIIGGTLLAAIWGAISALNVLIQAISLVISGISNAIKWISNLIAWFGNLVGAVRNAIGVAIVIASNFSAALRDVLSLVVGIAGTARSSFGVMASAIGAVLGTISPVTDALERLFNAARKVGGAIGGLKSVGHSLHIPGFATGTSYAPGGLAVVGERGPELVDLPRGSKVYTNQQSQQMSGSATFNMYGNINLGSQDAVDRFFDRLNAQKEMAALGVGV